MSQKVVCVRRTSTVEEAALVVAWLAEQGIAAQMIDRDNPGVFLFGVTDPEGVAICVADEETAGRARTLLDEHDRQREAKAKTAAGVVAVIKVKCDECGRVNEFPPEKAESVQQCPECNAYLDVPGAS